jgi:uncharacterized SAM-binding protein YcdF (DUF218 family)
VKKSKRRLLILLLIILLIVFAAVTAPRYLQYSSSYSKTDAIILFLGPDFSARQKEAYKIIDEGKADYLIIPAYHKIYKISYEGPVRYLSTNLSSNSSIKNKNFVSSPLLNFHEDTHLEILEAKRMMAEYDLRSAIFVSSPFHMRRIKVIVAKVFNVDGGDFYFVPTSFEKAPDNFWELTWADWKKVGRECGKILWFLLYSPWA